MKKPYAQARLYLRLVVNWIAWTYWLVRIVVLLLGGNRRNEATISASLQKELGCDVVDRALVCEFVFFVLAITNACCD